MVRQAPERLGRYYIVDSGMDKLPPNFVMHSGLMIFGSPVSMTDGGCAEVKNDNFSFMIDFDSADEVTAVFNKLADGGKVIEALAPQFWADLYGFVQDKFGVGWQVMTTTCTQLGGKK